MTHLLKPFHILGLLVVGITAVGAPAWAEGPCAKIRAACEGAGFAPGAAREGIGLQIHCMMPIMQASAQAPGARRPLPKVDPQLVADCRASNARFGPALRPPADIAEEGPPPNVPPSGPAGPNDRGARGQVSATANARPVEPAPRARPKAAASEKPAAGISSQAAAASAPPAQAPAAKREEASAATTAMIPTTPRPPAPADIGEE